jgi:dTDP-4-amino-4,6-dideoxygalactose transaminase
MIPFLDLKAINQQHRQALIEAATRVIDSGWYVLGQEVKAFEKDFAKYIGAAECVSVANGTDALRICMQALGLGRDSKICTVANAGFYSSTAIISIGAHPIYVDVDLETNNINLEIFSKFLESTDIDAVVLTHLYGAAISDLIAIIELCRTKGILVIEDCAQAHGAKIDGRMVGTFGDIAAFSFYPTKNLGALGDAGAVVSSSPTYISNARSLRTYGWEKKYQVSTKFGSNSRMDELQAGFLSVFLPNLDSDNQRRRQIAEMYNEVLNKKSFIQPPKIEGEGYVAHLYVVRTEKRSLFENYFKENSVQTAIHYPIPDHRQPVVAQDISLANTEMLSAQVLTLPCRPDFNDSEIAYMLDVLRNIRD